VLRRAGFDFLQLSEEVMSMKSWMACGLSVAAAIAVGSLAMAEEAKKPAGDKKEASAEKPKEGEAKKAANALDFTVKDIKGNDVALSKYKGKVVMIVNVASKCGNTKQYKGLQALDDKYREKGLVILGFPANNFGKQEPGTDKEIAEFCEGTYKVKFDMFSKISVKGKDQAPLYAYLTENAAPGKKGKDVAWNFEKFLIGRDGKIVARIENGTDPESAEVVKLVEAELAKQ
jgi:glutathione peroxidase